MEKLPLEVLHITSIIKNEAISRNKNFRKFKKAFKKEFNCSIDDYSTYADDIAEDDDFLEFLENYFTIGKLFWLDHINQWKTTLNNSEYRLATPSLTLKLERR